MKKLLVILLVLGMVAPAMAAEWNFYGNARMHVGSYDRSEEFAGSGSFAAGDGFNSDRDTVWDLQGNSRIGANVKASDAVSGRFEFGISSSSVSSRLIYGVWNFGAGKLTVGQDYTPIDILYSNQISYADLGGDDDLLNCGMTYEGRKPQIKLAIQGFELALISPSTKVNLLFNNSGNTYADTDTTLPKIEVAYTFATDMFSIKPYFGYNSVDIETRDAANLSESIDSMVYGLAFKVKFGPGYVNGNVYGATNGANYGLTSLVRNDAFVGLDATGTEDDAQLGGALVLGFKVNDMITLEAGYGMIQDEIDVATGITAETAMTSYYLQAAITLAPGVVITPEYGMLDLGDLEVTGDPDEKLGDCTYFAAKLQINF